MRSAARRTLMSSVRTGGNDAWQTPLCVLKRVREVGQIDLDPCWGEGAITYPAEQKFDGEEFGCGLEADWCRYVSAGCVAYVNPPYGAMAAWSSKISTEARNGVAIVALVAARVDTRWWGALWDVADVVAFWRGRIRFISDGKQGDAAPFPSAVLGFNVGHRRFRSAFGNAGKVVVP